MHDYYYNPEVKFLLRNQSDEKKQMFYADSQIFWVPIIGVRPPYYFHPRYEQYYPVI